MGLDRLPARKLGRLAVSRKVDLNQFARMAQSGQEGVPGVQASPQPMNHQ